MNPKNPTLAWAAAAVILTCATPAIAKEPAGRPLAKLQEEFLSWKFGLFACFHLGTFNQREFANGYEDPLTFSPTNLDCGQWADAAKAAGMKYAVLTTKHTEGYPLWDSASTTHDITAFKNYKGGKGDIVREFADAFRKRGIKIGFYYCAPGNFDNRNGNTLPEGKPSLHGLPPEAAGDFHGFVKTQISELLTNYGPVDLLWIDQYRVELSREQWFEIKKHIHHLQPNCLVIANNSHDDKDTDIHCYEYPYLKKKRPGKELPAEGNAIASEVCDTITSDRWFWAPGVDSHLRSAEDVVKVARMCNERRANYLLSVAPDTTGRIPDVFVKRMTEIGALLEKN